MMFFTYLKSDEVLGPYIDHVKCEQCTESKLQLRGRFNYLVLELLNIPLFMTKRHYEYACSCGHCQNPNQKTQLFKHLKQQMMPWWYIASRHIGFVVFMLLGLWLYQQYLDDQKRQLDLLATPQVNDFYFFDYHQVKPDSNPSFRYTTAKVTQVEGQNVSVVVSHFFRKRKDSVWSFVKADRPMIKGFFSSEVFTFSLTELSNMFEQGIIFAVERPKNLSIAGSIVIPMAQPRAYVFRPNLDNQIGIALYRGEEGYEQNYLAAFESFTKAAKSGHAGAQFNLAQMYLAGEGTEVDLQQAAYWFTQAREQKYPGAAEAIANLNE